MNYHIIIIIEISLDKKIFLTIIEFDNHRNIRKNKIPTLFISGDRIKGKRQQET